MELKDIIKQKREEKEMTMKQLAEKIGVSEGTISRWESGNIANMRRDKIYTLSKTLDIPLHVIMGWQWEHIAETKNKIPVLGRVPAGIPIDAIEDIIDFEEVNEKTASMGNLFALQIKGDSMSPRICDGDVVIVHQQPEAESGEVIIATINGDDAVCKRIMIYGDTVLLRSNNPAYDDINVTGRNDFRIIGKVIELRGKSL